MSFWVYKMLWPDNAMMSLKYSNFKIYLNIGSTKNTGHRNPGNVQTTTYQVSFIMLY